MLWRSHWRSGRYYRAGGTLCCRVVRPALRGSTAASPGGSSWAETCAGVGGCGAFPPRPWRWPFLTHFGYRNREGLARGPAWPATFLGVFAKSPGGDGSCPFSQLQWGVATPTPGSLGRRRPRPRGSSRHHSLIPHSSFSGSVGLDQVSWHPCLWVSPLLHTEAEG